MEAAFYQISMMKGVRILHSDADETSAQILYSLAAEEANKGNQIAIDEKYVAEHSQVFFNLNFMEPIPHILQAIDFLESVPHVNFVQACNLLLCNYNMLDIVNSTPDELQQKVRGLSPVTAKAIHEHLHRDVK